MLVGGAVGAGVGVGLGAELGRDVGVDVGAGVAEGLEVGVGLRCPGVAVCCPVAGRLGPGEGADELGGRAEWGAQRGSGRSLGRGVLTWCR
jgi:hypothetical protein